MRLVSPIGRYVGGLIELKFDTTVSELQVRINGSPFHTEEGAGVASNMFTLDVNGFPPDTTLNLVLTYKDPSGQNTSSLTLHKPRHDLGGMGATPVRFNGEIDGVFFKLWLPQVKDVFVRGSFNDWKDSNRLDQLGNSGYWYGYSRKARPGDDYRFFVYTFDGKAQEVSDPAARQTKKTRYNSSNDANDANAVVVDPDAFPWRHDNDFVAQRRDHRRYAIYQAHWGTFLSTTAKEAPYETFVQGSTEQEKRTSVCDRLRYVVDLGFTALELLPVHEANGNRNAGYDPSFLFAVESAYGTPDDLRILVDEAHRLGLAVIFDSVVNHLTNDPSHSSFSQEFIRGWYVRTDAPWSNHKQWGGSDWGPDPDWGRPEIRNLLTDCMLMYLREFHVDGIRFDATTCIPGDALQSMIGRLRTDASGTGKYFIAEHLTDDPLPYIVGQEGFDASWFKPAFQATSEGLLKPSGRGDLGVAHTVFEVDFQGRPESAIKYLLGSHDECWAEHGGKSPVGRFGGQDNEYARMKVRLAWSLNGLCLATPMLFMGCESMRGIDWSNDAGYDGLDWWNPGDAGAGFRELIRRLNGLRTEHAALRGGNIDSACVHWDANNSVVAWKRWDSGGGVFLVVANFSDGNWQNRQYQVRTGTPGSRWREVFNSQFVGFGGWTGADNSDPSFHPSADGSGLLQGINLAKWSLVLLKQEL